MEDTQKDVGTFYTVNEERANVITHLFGLIGALIAGAWLIARASVTQSVSNTVSASIYVTALALLFAFSLMYHAMPSASGKRRWRKLDHAGIYLFIAASYTPFLVADGERFRLPMLIIVWTIAVAGIVFKLFFTGRFDQLAVASYLLMGWLAMFIVPDMWRAMPSAVWWLLLGGLSFTAGVGFFLWERLPFNHAVWHLWVIAGCACHFVAIAGLVA